MKQTLSSALDDAVEAKLLTREQSTSLQTFLQERGIGADEAATQPTEERDDASKSPVVDSEAPRFIRGFHDILITIGILAALVGIWTMVNAWAALAATWVLAEIFVKHQRLALPAFTLTMSVVVTVTTIYIDFMVPNLMTTLSDIVPREIGEPEPELNILLPYYVYGFLSFFVSVGIFYWRFRIPVALALLIVGFGGFLFTGLLWVLDRVSGESGFFYTYPTITMLIALLFSLAVLAIAIKLDLSDRTRITRRSDVAFWLHLCAAPLLLSSAVLFIFSILFDVRTNVPFASYPSIVIMVVILLMFIGIVIDRRAFVTAGLVSLGTAIAALVDRFGGSIDDYLGLTVLIVGLIVLCLGSNWQRVRNAIVGRFPDHLQRRLPPIRLSQNAIDKNTSQIASTFD